MIAVFCNINYFIKLNQEHHWNIIIKQPPEGLKWNNFEGSRCITEKCLSKICSHKMWTGFTRNCDLNTIYEQTSYAVEVYLSQCSSSPNSLGHQNMGQHNETKKTQEKQQQFFQTLYLPLDANVGDISHIAMIQFSYICCSWYSH